MTTRENAEQASAAQSAAHWPEVLAYRGLDAAALLAGQKRALEAWAAATQKFIEGMQELSKRQVLLQTTLIEQAFADAASFATIAASGKADEVARVAQASMQKRIEALRNAIDASCRCSMDAMTAFRERMAGDGARSPACEREPSVPTTAEVLAAQTRSGRKSSATPHKAAAS